MGYFSTCEGEQLQRFGAVIVSVAIALFFLTDPLNAKIEKQRALIRERLARANDRDRAILLDAENDLPTLRSARVFEAFLGIFGTLISGYGEDIVQLLPDCAL